MGLAFFFSFLVVGVVKPEEGLSSQGFKPIFSVYLPVLIEIFRLVYSGYGPPGDLGIVEGRLGDE